jgi:hypothetical protein
MKQNFKKQLQEHLREVRIVEPNDLGVPLLTLYYRKVNKFFKTAPFIFVVPLTLLSAALLVVLFGVLAIQLTSLLQYGF